MLQEHSQSQLQIVKMVTKVVYGLGQVMSRQPEVLKLKEKFPGPQWDSAWLQVFGFNFGW